MAAPSSSSCRVRSHFVLRLVSRSISGRDNCIGGSTTEGVVGYSEGALVAATLLMEEQRRCEASGEERRLKLALFFTGWPVIDYDKKSFLFADETEERLRVPSVHVIGAGDPFLQGALALYNVFDEDTAILFDHAKGHTLPRDGQTVKELGDALRDGIRRSKGSG